MNGERPTSISTTVDKAKLYDAQTAAVELRTLFDKMAPLERAIAARSEQFKAIRRLVEAVEAL